eukprot:Colp12_sorted_trinity150504_noHs@3887
MDDLADLASITATVYSGKEYLQQCMLFPLHGGIIKVTQEKEAVFVCSQAGCGRQFKELAACKTHERAHGLHQTYACPQCHKKFSTETGWAAHLKSHNVNDRTPFTAKEKLKKKVADRQRKSPINYTEDEGIAVDSLSLLAQCAEEVSSEPVSLGDSGYFESLGGSFKGKSLMEIAKMQHQAQNAAILKKLTKFGGVDSEKTRCLAEVASQELETLKKEEHDNPTRRKRGRPRKIQTPTTPASDPSLVSTPLKATSAVDKAPGTPTPVKAQSRKRKRVDDANPAVHTSAITPTAPGIGHSAKPCAVKSEAREYGEVKGALDTPHRPVGVGSQKGAPWHLTPPYSNGPAVMGPPSKKRLSDAFRSAATTPPPPLVRPASDTYRGMDPALRSDVPALPSKEKLASMYEAGPGSIVRPVAGPGPQIEAEAN